MLHLWQNEPACTPFPILFLNHRNYSDSTEDQHCELCIVRKQVVNGEELQATHFREFLCDGV